MRASLILLCFAAVLTAACGRQPELYPELGGDGQAIEGGWILSASEIARAGVLDTGGCTRTIIYNSAAERRTWILTAAHCFFDGNGNFTGGSNVFIHPSYDSTQDTGPYDLALVRGGGGREVETPSGTILREYFRPVWASNPGELAFTVIGAGNTSGNNPNLLCNYPDPADDGTVRAASGVYDQNGEGVISTSTLSPSGSYLGLGDSGSAWLTSHIPGWESKLNNGIVAGVTSSRHCNTGNISWRATSTWSGKNKDFLRATMGSDLHEVSGAWARACWTDWCNYSSGMQAALVAPML